MIRQAILKAADSIEKNPNLFSFGSVVLPSLKSCGTPGCALGWIGHYLGIAEGDEFFQRIADRLNVKWCFHSDNEFYPRMTELAGSCWRDNASNCAKALRLYADKYHPAIEMPESIRKIFDTEFVVEDG